MTAVTIIFVVILGLWMVLRGYRRGATAIVLGWLPVLLLIATLNLAVYYRWAEAGSLKAKLTACAAAATLLFVVGWGLYRVVRKSPSRKTENGPVVPGWPARINRVAGAVLGLFCLMFTCLVLSTLAGTLVFRATIRREQEKTLSGAEPGPPPKWIDGLRTASNTLAGIGDAGLLKHVPYARQYSHEVRSVVTILNAPADQLKRVADKRRLWEFVEIPEVREALVDEEYRTLILRIRTGDLMALDSITRSPVTKALLNCPEIRELARSMRPSDLAKDLAEQVPSEPEGEAQDAGLAASDQAVASEEPKGDDRLLSESRFAPQSSPGTP